MRLQAMLAHIKRVMIDNNDLRDHTDGNLEHRAIRSVDNNDKDKIISFIRSHRFPLPKTLEEKEI